MTHSDRFSGTRVLIVEDEFLLAEETRLKLEALGATVIGPTPDVDEALEYLDTTQVDAAILDIYLTGEFVFPVAERLQDMGIPFVFASAYDAEIIPSRFEGFVLCEKPFELEKIAQALFASAQRDH
ncbi:response regulator [Hoeflea sp. YIM 152468]|uniref:response regulator n=1 Tax=Hoeflea sp. YIM 152468 TaxID=3031759 RepID=UPI0023DB59AE|nr:response regulator [Hoeflea sp. YIM 152468]MDF1609401.1 response regulator [Hoeflea sp. YIM 152468]